jgi:hypothetical protein
MSRSGRDDLRDADVPGGPGAELEDSRSMSGDVFDERIIALVEEMIAAWREAPDPPRVELLDETRAAWYNAGAAAVMWGWAARVMRMAEATLTLHRDGFDVEVSPLLRSMLEHAIALPWVADKRGAAYQTLARERANGWARFQAAQADGWPLEGEATALLETAVSIETDEDTFSEDTHLATFHRAQTYELGALYQAWLIETWSTHATLMSAEPYFDVDTDTRQGRLYRAVADRADNHRVSGGIAIAVHTALACYEKVHPDAFPGRLHGWEAAFEQIMADMKAAEIGA